MKPSLIWTVLFSALSFPAMAEVTQYHCDTKDVISGNARVGAILTVQVDEETDAARVYAQPIYPGSKPGLLYNLVPGGQRFGVTVRYTTPTEWEAATQSHEVFMCTLVKMP